MKYFLILLLAYTSVLSFQVSAQKVRDTSESITKSTAKLTLEIKNVKSNLGRIFISIYNSPNTFLSPEKFKQQEIFVADTMVDGKIKTTYVLPVGEYAIAIFHDNNDNGKMDTNFIGIPNEPSGMSNGHVPKFGPPRYSESKFQLPEEGLLQVIPLN